MRALEPAREQHAEALMREPPLEGIAHEIMPLPAREGLDQDLVGARHDGDFALDAQPVRHLIGKPRPMARIGEQPPHAIGKIGGERKLAAVIGRHLGLWRVASG